MSFRKENGKKLNVASVNACIYHYGWVKPPKVMQQKQLEFHKLWHDDKWVEENIPKVSEFDFSNIDSLSLFKDSHPKVMEQWLKRLNWKFTFDPTKAKRESFRLRILNKIYKVTNIHIGEFKNYILVKK